MTVETTGWTATEYLDSDAAILAYLEAAFEDGDPPLIAAALSDVAKVRGIAEQPKPDIALDSVIRTLKALGLELTAKAA
ncbi:transcriptional regulator [Sphingomonas sp. UV9]|uniref:helix-turn-helix domain-containing transcriptional regulator n=1 Tax=Sphingomonas sp. UV9 TaxID=1851410 RepID=UPI000FFB983C|nr:transcriptional regulator [Sphingomonas sp. UV9]RXD03616.1 transcriptional regulator [Sphingomonas sp. UV9]